MKNYNLMILYKKIARICLLFWSISIATLSFAQTTEENSAVDADNISAPEQAVAVKPVARDIQIQQRLSEIMMATDWFEKPVVTVKDGVVFLDGVADNKEQKNWAKALANKTQDVVAVVDRIEIKQAPLFNFSPAVAEAKRLGKQFIAFLPTLILTLIIIPLAWLVARGIYRLAKRVMRPSIRSPLLNDIVAKVIAFPFLLLGIYLVLQVAGLTKLALSLVGGAGVIGIVIGFAFRDIAENFLASLLLSIRQPFKRGDYIRVANQEGLVQSMNTRSTLLLSVEGNHIQIPNAVVFKNIIENFATSPSMRCVVDVGIGYDASIQDAQAVILDVLENHETLLDTPKPLVLVDTLGASTVNMKVYFWFDSKSYSRIKVQSSVLRLICNALIKSGISMPDDAREVIFPQGIPVINHHENDPVVTDTEKRQSSNDSMIKDNPHPSKNTIADCADDTVTEAEGALANENQEIEANAEPFTAPENEGNLLED